MGESSSNNQIRGGASGSVHRPNQALIDANAIGSGGAHPDIEPEEGEEDDEDDIHDEVFEEGDEDEDDVGDDDQDDEYDPIEGNEGYYDGEGSNEGGPIGIGAGINEEGLGEDYAEGEEGALDEEGEIEHGQDDEGQEDDGEGANRKRKLANRNRGAAHGLNSGSGGVHQHNF